METGADWWVCLSQVIDMNPVSFTELCEQFNWTDSPSRTTTEVDMDMENTATSTPDTHTHTHTHMHKHTRTLCWKKEVIPFSFHFSSLPPSYPLFSLFYQRHADRKGPNEY